MTFSSGHKCIALLLMIFIIPILGLPGVAGEEPNVGVLRVSAVEHPRQVAPSSTVSFMIDVEYAIKESSNATIKSALFEGPVGNLGAELWHSDEATLSGGGDKLWTANLTAPSTEQDWIVTVFAYYLENNTWNYYSDPDQGPGFAEATIKIAKLATLEIYLGAASIPVKVGSSTQQTSSDGQATLQLPVGAHYEVSVPFIMPFENSTRFVFAGWDDGVNSTMRTLLLDGNTRLTGSYKVQYLLKTNSIVPSYSSSAWYDAGTNVTLQSESMIQVGGPLAFLGLHYTFRGWSGDIVSNAISINLVVDKPKVINADFVIDYSPLVIPVILVVGVLCGVALAFIMRRNRRGPEAVEGVEERALHRICEHCGETVETDWTHCVKCGEALGSSSKPVEG